MVVVTLSNESPTHRVGERPDTPASALITVSNGASDRPRQKSPGPRHPQQLTPAMLDNLNAIEAIDPGLLEAVRSLSGLRTGARAFQ
jgi:hypothetical protein